MSNPLAASPVPLNFYPTSPINFVINFSRMPQLSFTVQEANIPDVIAESALQMAPGINIKRPPDKLHYNDLSVKFLIDEEFLAYRELYNWMVGVTGGPDREINVSNFLDSQEDYILPEYDRRKTYAKVAATNAALTVVNGAKTPVVKFVFYNVMITALSGARFNIKQDPLDVITGTATFTYDYYEILPIKK